MNAKKMLAAIGIGAAAGVGWHLMRNKLWPKLRRELGYLRDALEELSDPVYLGLSDEEYDGAVSSLQGEPAKAEPKPRAQTVTVPYEEGDEPTAAKTLAKFLGITEELAAQMIKRGGAVKVIDNEDAEPEHLEKSITNPEDTNATKAAWKEDEDEFLSPPLDE